MKLRWVDLNNLNNSAYYEIFQIPTGVPLVYDVNRKCIRLLDDGSGDEDIVSKYNL